MKYAREAFVLLAAAGIGLVSGRGFAQVLTTAGIVSDLAKEKASLLTVGMLAINAKAGSAGPFVGLDKGQLVLSRMGTADPADAAACAKIIRDIRTAAGVDWSTGTYRTGFSHSTFSTYFVQAEVQNTPASIARMQEIDKQMLVSAAVDHPRLPGSARCSGKLMSTTVDVVK
jgi:hypothetical protein